MLLSMLKIGSATFSAVFMSCKKEAGKKRVLCYHFTYFCVVFFL